jgi:hypothetical protein
MKIYNLQIKKLKGVQDNEKEEQIDNETGTEHRARIHPVPEPGNTRISDGCQW